MLKKFDLSPYTFGGMRDLHLDNKMLMLIRSLVIIKAYIKN